jgi:hypothetical protein
MIAQSQRVGAGRSRLGTRDRARSWALRATVTIIWIAVGGCRGNAQNNSVQEQASWLVVVPDAKDLETLDNGSVRYSVSVPYPANDVIAQIGNELQLRGWQPVDEDLVGSGAKNSHANGWLANTLDADGNFIYRWQADWTDENKNGATYSLIYRYAPAAGNSRENGTPVGCKSPRVRQFALSVLSLGRDFD